MPDRPVPQTTVCLNSVVIRFTRQILWHSHGISFQLNSISILYLFNLYLYTSEEAASDALFSSLSKFGKEVDSSLARGCIIRTVEFECSAHSNSLTHKKKRVRLRRAHTPPRIQPVDISITLAGLKSE